MNRTALEALEEADWSPTKAARLLQIPRTSLCMQVISELSAARSAPAEKIVAATEHALRRRVKELQSQLSLAVNAEQRAVDLYEAVRRVPVRKLLPPKKTGGKARLGAKHMMVPDVQQKNGVPTGHLAWAGEYAAEKKPDTIFIIGDWWDMPSLSSYDRGKLQFEGRRYRLDIEAGRAAMELFLAPIRKAKNYRPRIVFTHGNHEHRIVRVVEEDARLDGTIGLRDLQLEALGLETHEFLKPVVVDGVTYCHYFPRASSGAISQTKRGAPNARAQLIREGGTAVAGHQQGLDVACLPLRGKLQWGIIAGSFYQHEEEYLSPQGTSYWRGLVMLHEVKDGSAHPMLVSMDYLRSKYG